MSACGTNPGLRKTSGWNRGEIPQDFPKSATLKRGEPPPVLRKVSAFNRGEKPQDFPQTSSFKGSENLPVSSKVAAWNRGEPPQDFQRTGALRGGENPVSSKVAAWNRGEPQQDFSRPATSRRNEPPPVMSRISAWNPGEAPNPLFGSSDIQPLDTCSFDEFIADKEKALIMFYSPCAPDTILTAKEFATASNRPHPQNHAFASVDCSSEAELCCQEKATRLPVFKVYSNGFEASTIKFAKTFTADQMNMLIKMTPVLTGPKAIIGSP